MELSWAWVPSMADWATLIAAAIAVLGAISVWLSRPRVMVEPRVDKHSTTAWIEVRHRKGTAPIRGLHYALIGTDTADRAQYGDGMELWAPQIWEGGRRLLTLYDPAETSWGDGPSEIEIRRDVASDYGVVVGLSWQSPLLPWLRTHCTLVWPHSVRKAGGAMNVLNGRSARRVFELASKPSA